MIGKIEMFIVVHAIIGDAVYAEHDIEPRLLLFWDRYKEGCEYVIEGDSVVVYGEARCAGVTRNLILSLAVQYLRKYYPEILRSEG